MDIEIPEVCIEEAQTVYDEGFFVEHRFGNGGHGGWKSASIHSFVEKGKDLDMGWFHTKNPERSMDCARIKLIGVGQEIAEVCPETKRWLEDFPHKSYRRLRFMLLDVPGASIDAHNDASPQRVREGRIRNIVIVQSILYFINQIIVT